MKLSVTGATGFIGRHLVENLVRAGHDVRCFVRRAADAPGMEAMGASVSMGDVTDRSSLQVGLAGRECVVNLANVYSMWEPDKAVYEAVNVAGTRNVLQCALECGVSKIVHVSTAGVYGKPAEAPFNEESEAGPRRFSRYARTKYEGELSARKFCEDNDLPLVVICPGAVIGPGDTKPTGKYIEDLMAGRMPVTVYRDVVMTYVDVGDVAEAIRLAVENELSAGETYLIGKHHLSFGEFNELIREATGVPTPKINLPDAAVRLSAAVLTAVSDATERPPPWGICVDQANLARGGVRFDGSKAERDLGLRYTPIRDTIKKTVASLRNLSR